MAGVAAMPNAKKLSSCGALALFLFALVFAAPGQVWAQSAAADPAGHWDGDVELPSGPLEVHLDLRETKGHWSGDIVIPTESTRSTPVTGIRVSGRDVSFGVEVQGGPRFEGTLEKKGAQLGGTFSEAGFDYPFKLVRARSGGGRVRGPGDGRGHTATGP